MKKLSWLLLMAFSTSLFAQTALECDLEGGKIRLDYLQTTEGKMLVARGLLIDEENPGSFYPSGNCRMFYEENPHDPLSSFIPESKDADGFRYCAGKLHNDYQIGIISLPQMLLDKKMSATLGVVNVADRKVRGAQGHYLTTMSCHLIKE